MSNEELKDKWENSKFGSEKEKEFNQRWQEKQKTSSSSSSNYNNMLIRELQLQSIVALELLKSINCADPKLRQMLSTLQLPATANSASSQSVNKFLKQRLSEYADSLCIKYVLLDDGSQSNVLFESEQEFIREILQGDRYFRNLKSICESLLLKFSTSFFSPLKVNLNLNNSHNSRINSQHNHKNSHSLKRSNPSSSQSFSYNSNTLNSNPNNLNSQRTLLNKRHRLIETRQQQPQTAQLQSSKQRSNTNTNNRPIAAASFYNRSQKTALERIITPLKCIKHDDDEMLVKESGKKNAVALICETPLKNDCIIQQTPHAREILDDDDLNSPFFSPNQVQNVSSFTARLLEEAHK